MVKKLITAAEILAEKNFVVNKFDQQGFNAKVAEFFQTHEVKDTLLLVPKRFVEMDVTGDPEMMDEAQLAEYERKQEELEEQKKAGWIDMTDLTVWERKVDNPYDPFTFTDYIIANNKGLIRPMVYVDEPFIKNAAYMLSTMAGFICKKQRGGKFVVSLI